MSQIAKQLRAERGDLIIKARAILNAADVTAEQMAEADKMMARADELMARIERTEKADALAIELDGSLRAEAERRGVSAGDIEAEKEREQRLFKAFVTGRVSALTDDDRRIVAQRIQAAASVGTTTAGGYTVAPDFMRELLIAQKAFGGVRGAARVIESGTGVDLPWPTMDDTSNVATIVGENTSGAAGTDLTFGSKTLKAWTYRSGYLVISLELLQDSAFNFDTLIRDALAQRFARGQNPHFTTGNGTTQPEGFVTGATVGYTMPTGNTATVSTDGLIELEHSVDPAYRAGARWMMADATFKGVKKLKDSQNRPLFLPGFTVGAADTVLGYPVSINQDMATPAANAKTIGFGNFQNYIVRDVMGLVVKRLDERFAENAQVGFIAFQRTDGRTVSAAAPIKVLAQSAT
ncbi:phage major capsid protein [Paracraurococcus lichenis]|uniref:Phage major capsid protein n=1 Tax=Paracraurococcus lichenis TaxID=3064888 RepID=A0ABT9E8Z0_9PROT|nr:phage major capsid protein [Paracraurococcus sp. LOR1-02]MDO9712448.1 phage major capsid protein [Paracraurococcus sp. LOR1-02]